uniref:Uncharacterized protein n=1 Tax=Arundo donax TaxID=35708 RepID=A0A0A9G230_ARUDO
MFDGRELTVLHCWKHFHVKGDGLIIHNKRQNYPSAKSRIADSFEYICSSL